MAANNHYLGVDGGGTKTEAVIADGSGSIIGRGYARGSNPHNLTDSEIISNIQQAVNQAKLNSHLETDVSFTAACFGVAGLDTDDEIDSFQKLIQPLVNTSKTTVCNDGLISFKSGTDSDHGICIIASTGSSCFGITTDNNFIKAGNWGHLMGDQGSGFAIGQAILRHSVKEYDGRQPPTGLTQTVMAHFEVENFSNLAQAIYTKDPVAQIASLATLISDPEYIHHSAIMSITANAVTELFEAFQAVAGKIPSADANDFPIVFAGKLFLAGNLITIPLTQKISSIYPTAQIIIPTKSPVEGAVAIALSR